MSCWSHLRTVTRNLFVYTLNILQNWKYLWQCPVMLCRNITLNAHKTVVQNQVTVTLDLWTKVHLSNANQLVKHNCPCLKKFGLEIFWSWPQIESRRNSILIGYQWAWPDDTDEFWLPAYKVDYTWQPCAVALCPLVVKDVQTVRLMVAL